MGCRLNVSPGAYLLAATAVWMLPAGWWSGAILAAAVHELSHLIVIRLTGGRVTQISIGPMGAKMETLPMTRGREALCAAAGPLGSLIMATTIPFFPEAALCAAAQGIYNLLPLYPLDGGRILKCLLPDSVQAAVQVTAVVLLLGVGLWCFFSLKMGMVSLIPGFITVFHMVGRKIPCKESNLAVQ